MKGVDREKVSLGFIIRAEFADENSMDVYLTLKGELRSFCKFKKNRYILT